VKINTDIVKASVRFVSNYSSKNSDTKFLYHNLSHTTNVVKAANTLCTVMGVDEHQKKVLLVSAWFHDLGYTQQIEGHERIGAKLAEEFLNLNGVNEEDIAIVKSCILSTYYPQKPTTFLEEILCDADLMYLGDEDFFITSALLRKEWELTKAVTYSDMQWNKATIQFLSSHHFHTEYGQNNVEKKKNKNIKLLADWLQSPTHNIFRFNGEPNDKKEVKFLKAFTDKKVLEDQKVA
jgi:predicted metal-dependent HD superfamily phosphohydrolase